MTDPATPAVAHAIEHDARNRAARTLAQVLAVEVLVVVLPLVLDTLDGDLTWAELGRSAVRAVVAAVLSYVMRKQLTPPPSTAPPEAATPGALTTATIAASAVVAADPGPPVPLSAADGLDAGAPGDAPVADANETLDPRRRR